MELSGIHFIGMTELKQRLANNRFRKPVVLLERRRASEWGLIEQLECLTSEGAAVWIDQVQPLPTQKSVWSAVRWLKDFSDIDGIISIGGGSAIDLAKALSGLAGMDLLGSDAVLDAITQKSYLDNGSNALPIIAVPTTAGTGSEVTQWATIWDSGSPKKYSIDAPHLLPEEVWIAPELTYTLPPRLTLSTGLDAVCHAVESYWSKSSTPLVKELSVRSLQIITRNLGRVLRYPEDSDGRNNMAVGALLAGLAFSQTRTTACHSISYPITSMYQVEHGFACALTLAALAEINAGTANLLSILEVFSPFDGIQPWLDEVCGDIVRLRLSGLAIPVDAIPIIAANAFTDGRMDNNPTQLNREDVQEILIKML